jgi:hypothetical protein
MRTEDSSSYGIWMNTVRYCYVVGDEAVTDAWSASVRVGGYDVFDGLGTIRNVVVL